MILIILGFVAKPESALALPKESAPPNILLIMADDLGAEALTSYGGTGIETPNIDKLAETGIRFRYCFSTPICTPSRVQILTGRYPFRTGWDDMLKYKGADRYLDPTKEISIATQLKKAGYETAIAGKWQLAQLDKHPTHLADSGFDRSLCWTWCIDETVPTRRYHGPSLYENGKPKITDMTDYGPDHCLAFLTNFIKTKRSAPFFAYYPMILPHSPFHEPPGSIKTKTPGKSGHYEAMVIYLDRSIGRLLKTLEEEKLDKNTLVIFCADNGCPTEIETKFQDKEIPGGKGLMSTTGAWVPLIANWPGVIKEKQVTSTLVDLSDMFPTLVEIGGAPLPEGVKIDGMSFASVLRGEKKPGRSYVYVQMLEDYYVRDQDWQFTKDGNLFDLREDPFSTKPVRWGQKIKGAARARKMLRAATQECRER